MKPISFTIILITFLLYNIIPQKAWADNKTKTFNITILNTAGAPQKNIFLKISGYSSEYPIDEQGNINFKHEINPSYIRTANLYFRHDKTKPVKSFQLDEHTTDTIFRIDSPDDLTQFKQSGRLVMIHGNLNHRDEPVSGAEIQIQGTRRKTLSDTDGNFSIEADYSHLIVIRAEGMENRYLDIYPFLLHPDEPLALSLNKKGAERIYSSVSQMPEFRGGMKSFFNYVKQKLHPSQLAEETGVEGTVMIQFVVEKNGSISSPSIVRSLHAQLDTAALNVIQTMPSWIAGKDNGTTVRCKYSVPIVFKKPQMVVSSDTTLQVPAQTERNSQPLQPAHLHFLNGKTQLQKPAFTAADSLQLKTIESYFIKPDSLQPKASKGNFLTRFFRKLFGKKKHNVAAVPQS